MITRVLKERVKNEQKKKDRRKGVATLRWLKYPEAFFPHEKKRGIRGGRTFLALSKDR